MASAWLAAAAVDGPHGLVHAAGEGGAGAGTGTGSAADDADLAEITAAMSAPDAAAPVDRSSRVIGTPDHAPTWSEFAGGWDLFREPVYAAGIAGAVLGFLSVYVVLRRMVFVSAAVTQAAGLGVALAFFVGMHVGFGIDPLWGATGLSLATAALLATDPRRIGLSREMVLGLLFATTAAGTVLVGSRIPQEAGDIQSILFGTAVVVTSEDMHRLAVSGALVLLLQIWLYRGFAFASFDALAARVQGLPVRALDLIMLLSIGAMVGESARALGALPAFALSTLPGMAALLVIRGPLPWTLALGALFGAAAGVGGYLVAFFFDFPVGSTQTAMAALLVVAALGVRGAAAGGRGLWRLARLARR